MRILAEPVLAEDLQPGDLFSTRGPAYWDNFAEFPSCGELVYIRTEMPASAFPDAESVVFRITIHKEAPSKLAERAAELEWNKPYPHSDNKGNGQVIEVRTAQELAAVLSQPEPDVIVQPDGSCTPSPPDATTEVEAGAEAVGRDDLLVNPKIVELAVGAAKRIARAENLDNVSAKEVYRTIIEAIVSAILAHPRGKKP